jgi:NAD(P)H-flavin reductase
MIVLTALRRGVAQPILLYAGIRRNNDHYLKDPLKALALVYPNFKIAVSVATAKNGSIDFEPASSLRAHSPGPSRRRFQIFII